MNLNYINGDSQINCAVLNGCFVCNVLDGLIGTGSELFNSISVRPYCVCVTPQNQMNIWVERIWWCGNIICSLGAWWMCKSVVFGPIFSRWVTEVNNFCKMYFSLYTHTIRWEGLNGWKTNTANIFKNKAMPSTY
jgi:hypothetical protein